MDADTRPRTATASSNGRPRNQPGDGRVPPHNLDAEAAVLGAMLLNGDAARTVVANGLTAGDFWKPANQFVYQALKSFVDIDIPFDTLLIADELRSDGLIEQVGGTDYLLELTNATPAIGHVIRHAQIVQSTALMRRVIATAAEIAEIGYSESTNVFEAIADAELKLIELADSAGPKENRFEKMILIGDQITTIPPPVPLIEGLLFRHGISVIFGKPGAAKSFLALDWAASIASGTWWMGRKVHAGRVLYVIAEGAEGMGNRFNAWRTARNVRDLSELHWLPTTVNLFNPGDVADLIAYAKGRGYEMIVVDTLARCSVGADEVSGKDIGVIIDALERLRIASGAAIMLVHHTPKDGETMRGHTALEGAVDTTIKVGQTDGIIKVENKKQKNAAVFPTITLSLIDFEQSAALVAGTTRLDPDGDKSISRMVAMMQILDTLDDGHGVARGLWKDTTEHEISINKSTFAQVLKQLKERAYVEQTADNQRAPWKLTDMGRRTIEPPQQVSNDDFGNFPPDEGPE